MKQKQKSVNEAWVVEMRLGDDYYYLPHMIFPQRKSCVEFIQSCTMKEEQPVIRKWRAEKVCEWRRNDIDGYYETECGDAFIFNDGTPRMNNAKFCPYCGGKIKVRK